VMMQLRAVCLAGAMALAMVAPATAAETAASVLKQASDAMGAGTLQSIRFEGDGVGYAYGQSYKPGMPWPKFTLHTFPRSIDYPGGAMRTEFTLSRAEPKGGGGYPLSGQQKNDQYLRGDVAWNVTGPNIATGPHLAPDRMHQLWISPHGAIKAAQANN